jgi:flagellar motor switch/type III secretory pathway protein FliN
MRQRPFSLIGNDVLDAVRRLLDGALRDWCADWGVERDGLVLECLRAWEGEQQLPAAPAWRQPWRSGDGMLSLAWAAELPAQLQKLLFAPDRQYMPSAGTPHTAVAAGAAAWDALVGAMAAAAMPGGAAAGEAAAPPAEHWRRASGALLIVLRVGKQACHAVLDHEALQALAEQLALRGALRRPAADKLAPVDFHAMLADLPVALPVALGSAQVDFGSLVGLRAGDVIRLDTAADSALQVRGPSGAALFDGYLGRAGEAMALELIPHESTNGVKHEHE